MTTPTPPTADDWLEQALHAGAREHRDAYLDDDGFTAQVMAALPPPVEAVPRWRRPVVTSIWVAAAAAAATALPGVAVDVGREAFRLLAAQPVSLPQMGVWLAALGAATWAAAAWALRSD
ncbi:MAG TPA: hypothetical protein VF196_05710 [Casimicrobiaceae bacterium]